MLVEADQHGVLRVDALYVGASVEVGVSFGAPNDLCETLIEVPCECAHLASTLIVGAHATLSAHVGAVIGVEPFELLCCLGDEGEGSVVAH